MTRERPGQAGVRVAEALQIGLIEREDLAGARRVLAEPALAAERRRPLERRPSPAARRAAP